MKLGILLKNASIVFIKTKSEFDCFIGRRLAIIRYNIINALFEEIDKTTTGTTFIRIIYQTRSIIWHLRTILMIDSGILFETL